MGIKVPEKMSCRESVDCLTGEFVSCDLETTTRADFRARLAWEGERRRSRAYFLRTLAARNFAKIADASPDDSKSRLYEDAACAYRRASAIANRMGFVASALICDARACVLHDRAINLTKALPDDAASEHNGFLKSCEENLRYSQEDIARLSEAYCASAFDFNSGCRGCEPCRNNGSAS